MIKTVSLETAKLLKESGFRQVTDYSHWQDNRGAWNLAYPSNRLPDGFSYISAPTTDELLEELPDRINEESGVLMIHKTLDHYEVMYGGWNKRFDSLELPEALAQCWIWLKKEGLL